MRYYLWIRWDAENKEAFEVNESSSDWVEANYAKLRNGTWKNDTWFSFSTPSNKTMQIKLLSSLAYKIVTRETIH